MSEEIEVFNVKCDKCGSMRIVEVREREKQFTPPPETMSEYVTSNRRYAVTLEMRYHWIHLKCLDCGFEVKNLVP